MRAAIITGAELGAFEITRWRQILASNPALRSPFFAPEFTLAIAAARNDVRIAVLEQAGRIVGFLPFHRLAGGIGKPVGGPISDYQGPILAADVDVEARELLSACRLNSYDFNHAPAALRMLSGGSVHFAASPHIDLGGGYAAYVAGRSKSGRHAIKDTERRMRKIAGEIGPVRFAMDDFDAAAWTSMIAMKSASYRRLGVPSAFEVDWIFRALAAIRDTKGETFSGVLSTVYAGDRLIAANFGMCSQGMLCWWFNTYDYELRDRAPGLILLLKAAQHLAEHGPQFIDFGRGDEHYKLAFANGTTELCEGSIELPRSMPGALRRAQKLALRSISHVPLGPYANWPRRAMARLLTGMRLPAGPA